MAMLLCFLAVVPSASATTTLSNSDQYSDFADYVPVYNREDAYDDEAFMYFDRPYVVSAGSGAQAWTGAAAEVFRPALPILDLRFMKFIDFRSALQLGMSLSSFHGEAPTVGPTDLRMLRWYVDYKYYIMGSDPSHATKENRFAVTPSPYFSVGLSAIDVEAKFLRTGESIDFRTTESKLPLVGRVPIPVLPSVGLGMDFAIYPRSTSATLELRWSPIGSILGKKAEFERILGEKGLGDTFFVGFFMNFSFQ